MNPIDIVVSEEDTPFTALTTGSSYWVRSRWATESDLLVPGSGPGGTFLNYSETPAQWVVSPPWIVAVDPLFWAGVKVLNRNVYCTVEARLDDKDEWTQISLYHFVINHNPTVTISPLQVVQLDSDGNVTSDVFLDGRKSTDIDLGAASAPDPGPLHYKWMVTNAPNLATVSNWSDAELSTADNPRPLFTAKGTSPIGGSGIYAVTLAVSDNDVAQIGPNTNKHGTNTAVSHIVFSQSRLADIYVSAFIPYATVRSPIPQFSSFGGDSRVDAKGHAIFSKTGKARCWNSAIVDLQAYEDPLVYSAHGVSPTYAYNEVPPSKGRGTVLSVAAIAQASPIHLRESASTDGVNVTVNVSDATSNPLIVGAPPIYYNFYIDMSYNGYDGTVSYNVFGDHDFFPAYEVYIGDKLVYSYDPIGHTPWSLMWPTKLLKGVTAKSVRVGGTMPVDQAYKDPRM